MFDQIPVKVLEQFEGKWIIWDENEQQVIGSGDTLDEAENQAAPLADGHLLRVHHVLPRGEEVAGML